MSQLSDIEVIRATASADVMSELNELMEGVEHDPDDWPDGYTLADAFDDFSERVELPDYGFSAAVIRNVRQIQIALGVAVEVTEEQLSRTIQSAGRKYWFKLDGKKYRSRNG